MTDHESQPIPPTIHNTGPVHVAAQGGDGYVGAMGDNARGYVFTGGKSPVNGELAELIAELRALLESHADQLSDHTAVSDAVDDLEDKINESAASDKIKRSTRVLLRLTHPVQAFADLIARINELIDQFRS